MSIRTLKGEDREAGYSIGIVVSKWNSFITDRLLEGALDVLKSNGYDDEQMIVAYCPGAYEIPLASRKLLDKTDGVIALGAVIRGDTPHFDYVCDAVNRGVSELNMETGKPVAFGVLTTDTVSQARERAGLEGDQGNKGAEAALALLDMLSLLQEIDKI